MNIYQQQKLTDYHIRVTLAKYANQNTLIKLMHGDNKREVYRIHGGASLTQVGVALPKLSAFWASEYSVGAVDVIVEDTLLGAALLDFLTEQLTTEWHPGLPLAEGYYFVTDGKTVNIAELSTPEPLFCINSQDGLHEVGSVRTCIDIHRNCVDTSAITYHSPVPYPSHWYEGSPQEDGWYFVNIRGVAKIGYSYTESYNGERLKEQRFIKTFDGNVYYPNQCFKHVEVRLPNPP